MQDKCSAGTTKRFMSFVRKIYYNNKPLVLTNSTDNYLHSHPIAKGYLQLTGAFPAHIRRAFDFLDKPHTLGVVVEDLNTQALIEEVSKLYEPVQAGGGVVQNETGDVLMIYRRGRWDLPKGKLDEGEDIAACALREVQEETGLQQIIPGEKIIDTWHIYAFQGQRLLKQTTWYRMKGNSAEKPHPQAEENIEEVRWVNQDELARCLFKSYEAIKEVLVAAGIKY